MINSSGGREISKSSRASSVRLPASSASRAISCDATDSPNSLRRATVISCRSSFISATAWRAATSSSPRSPSEPPAVAPPSLTSSRATCGAGRPSVSIRETTHITSPSTSACFKAYEISVAGSIVVGGWRLAPLVPDFDEDFHVAAADHSLFVGRDVRVVAQAEFAQTRFVFGQRVARFRPDVGFDASAADRAHHLAVFKNQQLGACALGRRAGGRHNRRHREFPLLALRPADLFVNFALRQ